MMYTEFELIREKILTRAESDIFLVGGAVRNLYLGRPITDFDFAYAGNAFKLAQDLAPDIGATFVPLDLDNDIARLVQKGATGNIYLDFAGFKGADITKDLKARDFTINAMAISLKDDYPEIYDPLGGMADIKSQMITAISETNMIADPIRILRAVRLAMELGYEIERKTFEYMLKNSSLLTKISSERIRDELFKAFALDAYNTVSLLDAIKFFDVLVPELVAAKGVVQNKHHTLDVWEHSLSALKHLEQEILFNEKYFTPEILKYLKVELVQGRSRKVLLKFAALIHDIGKPIVRQVHPEKGVTFWNHDLVGSEIAREIATRLALSKKEIILIEKIVKYHMRPLFLSKAIASPKALFKFFNETGEDGLGIMLLSMADTKGGKRRDAQQLAAFLQTIDDMLDFYNQEYLPKKAIPILRGLDIIKYLPELPENQVGDVLKKVQEAYTIGVISSREEALSYIKRKYSSANVAGGQK